MSNTFPTESVSDEPVTVPAQLVRCFAVRYFLNIYELLSSNVDTTAPLYACFRDRSVFPKNQAYRKERSFEEGQQIPV
ncbi:unnamed protein product [Hermetia illucens]|uniref:Uncharacterized protein n=1 Tax=Hermetia illucens TaxID=343691 RepID=A0A7R8V5D9_HERIL|nr:unnamed protein product [Hermetia illucens]